jgi:hypothetical protein
MNGQRHFAKPRLRAWLGGFGWNVLGRRLRAASEQTDHRRG